MEEEIKKPETEEPRKKVLRKIEHTTTFSDSQSFKILEKVKRGTKESRKKGLRRTEHTITSRDLQTFKNLKEAEKEIKQKGSSNKTKQTSNKISK